ncbi:tripartite tricarboxylate transporter permease [Pseudoclavibacter sp. 8L]|uniref:tripartite tricarboxylate transporter permease n=1 Tax=Pseudoclavibacter sp. 8L TaxID=2653162 RepID=UPI0012F2F708|nr:tripartite tricarboxylate transporter permease [Pseudoclavibacter sp. 8L]VXC06544.1 Uncharacterized 52.8 kDa protein in TAR-I ttuC' 3'region [Pseudoclavibacter sp. 8L]
MNPIEGLIYGLGMSLTPEILIAAVVAALVGTLIGVLPGLGPVAGASLVLPLTFVYEPAIGIILIAGIYIGAQYGGSTTSILLNIPGEASAIPATFDGYPMTKKGRAGAALVIVAVGAFIASTIALALLLLSAPFVTGLAISFGPPEYFALTAGGLFLLARISGARAGAGIGVSLLPMLIGLAMATVGTEPTQNVQRFTFGSLDLTLGLQLAPVAVGLYGISEIMIMLEERIRGPKVPKVRIKELVPSRAEWRESLAPWGRGSILGFVFGLLPIPSATMSAFASYRMEQAISKHPERFGKGAVPGLAGPEAANAAAAVGSMVPVLMLGLPFSATLALAVSAMTVQGIQPGPLLMEQHPDIFWTVIAALLIANVALLILNVPLAGVWVRVLQTPRHILVPVIVILAMIGSYSLNGNMLDVYVMVAMGLVGYVMRKMGFGLAALLVGLVLGPLIEKYFIQGMLISGGATSYFVSTPVSAIVWGLVVFFTVFSGIQAIRGARKARRDRAELSATTARDHEPVA